MVMNWWTVALITQQEHGSRRQEVPETVSSDSTEAPSPGYGQLGEFDHSFPQPPVDVAVSQGGLDIWVGVSALLAVSAFCLCVVLALRHRTIAPICLFIGAFIAVSLEPITNVVGNAWHSSVGQEALFSFFNRPVPLHIAIVYVFYFSLPVFMFFSWLDRRPNRRQFFVAYAGAVVGATLIEIAPLHWNLWSYYDDRPLRVFEFPLVWGFVNATALLFIAALIHGFRPYLTGLRALLIIVLVPSGFAMSEFGLSVFSDVALNVAGSTAALRLAADLATIGLAVVAVYLLSFVFIPAEDKSLRPATPPRRTHTAEAVA